MVEGVFECEDSADILSLFCSYCYYHESKIRLRGFCSMAIKLIRFKFLGLYLMFAFRLVMV